MRSVRIRVTGLVQGVGFRSFVRREASRLGLAGWIKNEPDGSVAAYVVGEEEKILALLDKIRVGPPASEVEGVEVVWLERSPEDVEGFHVR